MATREDEKISFYTFPRDVRSRNVYKKNCLVQKRKLYTNSNTNIYKDAAIILNVCLFYQIFARLNCEGKYIFK